MDFALAEEEELFRDTVRKWVASEIAPHVTGWEEEQTFPKHLFRQAGELGFFSVSLPEHAGGGGGGQLHEALFVEEVGKYAPGLAGGFQAAFIISHLIQRHGTAEQWERFGSPTSRGELLPSQGFTEPDAGSDLRAITTRATKRGSDYVIRGRKIFTSMAPFSDYTLVLAYLDRDAGIDGMAVFLVDHDAPGYEIARVVQTHAFPYTGTSEVVFEDVTVGADRLLGGEERGGFRRAMETLNKERILSSARAVGIAQAAFDQALEYAKQRTAFGKRIGDFQVNAHRLVDMLMHIECARNMVFKAAWLHDRGESYSDQIALTKIYATEMAERVTRDAVQMHGGYGVTKDFRVMRLFMDAKLGPIGGGSSEVMHRVVARSLGLEG